MKDKIRESQKTVSEIIEEIKAEICDDYCKYPKKYKDEDALLESDTCNRCPLNRL